MLIPANSCRLALSFAFLFSSALFAQGETSIAHQFEASASVTAMRFPGALPGSSLQIGGAVDASYNVTSRLALTGFYGYSAKSIPYLCGFAPFEPCQGDSVRSSVQPLQVGGRVNLRTAGRVIPYTAATVGAIRYGSGGTTTVTGLNIGSAENVTKFGFSAGGGVIVRVARHLDIKPDIKVIKGMQAKWLPVFGVGVGLRI